MSSPINHENIPLANLRNPLSVEIELKSEGQLIEAEAVTRLEDGFCIKLPVAQCQHCDVNKRNLQQSDMARPVKFTLWLKSNLDETSFSRILTPKVEKKSQSLTSDQVSKSTQTLISGSPENLNKSQFLGANSA